MNTVAPPYLDVRKYLLLYKIKEADLDTHSHFTWGQVKQDKYFNMTLICDDARGSTLECPKSDAVYLLTDTKMKQGLDVWLSLSLKHEKEHLLVP